MLIQLQNTIINTDLIELAYLDNTIPAQGDPPTVVLTMIDGSAQTCDGSLGAQLWEMLVGLCAGNVISPIP